MFKDILKQLREERDWTMEHLAKEYNQMFNAKMNKGTLSRYENGLQQPMYHTVVNFAKLFGVSVDELTGDSFLGLKPHTYQVNLELDENEQKLLDKYRALNEEGQEKLLGYAEDLTGNPKYKKSDKLSLDAKEA